MIDINEEKRTLRVKAAEARRVAHAADQRGEAAHLVAKHFLSAVEIPAAATIGGYWPIGTELDGRPLLELLHERGHVCGLPVVRRRQPLIFHRWTPATRLQPGIFGIPMPDQHTPEVVPDVLLVPMIAYDSHGRRLGYGGGYIDRTIPAIRARKKLLTVGIAYAAQQVATVPTDAYDQPLDWIVTERDAQRIERRRFPWLRRFFET
jgi:5-formyltetrahydrofolate cyclo-ligase